MKREVVFTLIFIIFLVSISLIHASEETQVESAYACLESRINSTGCSSLNLEEKVFSVLSTGKCIGELSKTNITANQCWNDVANSNSCKIKATAQAILALNQQVNTTKPERWLLSQTASPTNIEWFLEIESTDAVSCDITYSGSVHKISIGADKKIITANAGTSLTRIQDNYWLKIAPALYNQDIEISCDKAFITTLLFKKSGSSTVHVSDTVHKAVIGGTTTEKVESFCFSEGGVCKYEGSLWAALVLNSVGYEDEVKKFMPYLITMKDESPNIQFIPESFLYFLTGKFETELLTKQYADSYWTESGKIYYDTAVALLPFSSEFPPEKENSITWLLGVQQKSGCWNNGNIRDTAFILYSVWPKNVYDCPEISCEISSWSLAGECAYKPLGCADSDGCCNSGCTISNDNDCEPGQNECDIDSDCTEDYTSDPYCTDNIVYEDAYSYSCDTTGACIESVNEQLVETCASSDTCEAGACVAGGESCGVFNPCDTGYTCVGGICEANAGECDSSNPCDTGYDCVDGVCEPVDDSCGFFNPCDSGYDCVDGVCEPTGAECDSSNPCDTGYSCVAGVCEPDGGTCGFLNPCDEGYTCIGGACEPNAGECDSSNPCDTGYDCVDGVCEPVDDSCGWFNPCDTGYECVSGTCEPVAGECDSSNPCDTGYSCVGGVCEPDSQSCGFLNPCPDGEDCISGLCVPQEGCETLGCPSGYTCTDGACVADSETCSWFNPCPDGEDCISGICVPQEGCETLGCPSGYTCTDGECIEDSQTCGFLNPCDTGYTCVGGTCVENGGECNLTNPCDEGYTCNDGVCEPVDLSCSFFNPCGSGYDCVNGECSFIGCQDYGCDTGYTCIDTECVSEGQCSTASDCPQEDCKDVSCESGTCMYVFKGCYNGDFCCNPGCNSSNDDYCEAGPECTSDSDCADNNYQLDPVCSNDGNAYIDFYNYTCESQVCTEEFTEQLVDNCDSATEECFAGECYSVEPTPCGSNDDCGYDQCVNGECIPFQCTVDEDCSDGTCSIDGECIPNEVSDCETEGYYCTSQVNCENSYGNQVDEYACASSLFVCCDTPPILETCADQGGEICSSDKECFDGREAVVSDDLEAGEVCCIAGTCEDMGDVTYCEEEGATCRPSSCDSGETEKSYVCDIAGEICCAETDTGTTEKSKAWVLILILLILIVLAGIGIVFRDKLRIQWMKIKDKFSGKKDKKKFDMPATSVMNTNPQGRILPRRILPPGAHPQGYPQSRFPLRPGQGISQPGAQQSKTQQAGQPSTTPNKPGEPAKTGGTSQTTKGTTESSKKPEEKPKEKPKGELDDVLKKLRDMSK